MLFWCFCCAGVFVAGVVAFIDVSSVVTGVSPLLASLVLLVFLLLLASLLLLATLLKIKSLQLRAFLLLLASLVP
jgi:hypothetical protein